MNNIFSFGNKKPENEKIDFKNKIAVSSIWIGDVFVTIGTMKPGTKPGMGAAHAPFPPFPVMENN